MTVFHASIVKLYPAFSDHFLVTLLFLFALQTILLIGCLWTDLHKVVDSFQGDYLGFEIGNRHDEVDDVSA